MSKGSQEEVVKARFEKCVEQHDIVIERAAGVFRSVLFRSPDSGIHAFRLVTWPGALCISGDVGTFVFERIDDMFEFFRDRPVNSHYWHEKCVAAAYPHGCERFSADRARESVLTKLGVTEVEAGDVEFDEFANTEELWAMDEPERAKQLGRRFLEMDGGASDAEDFWWSLRQFEDTYRDFVRDLTSELQTQEFTHQYLWCLHAIVWGIARYDAVTAVAPAGGES